MGIDKYAQTSEKSEWPEEKYTENRDVLAKRYDGGSQEPKAVFPLGTPYSPVSVPNDCEKQDCTHHVIRDWALLKDRSIEEEMLR